jgi:DNA polymerase-3 subunit gamma/tau
LQDALRDPVLNALAQAGHQMLVSMLEGGQWQIAGNELVIKVPSSSTVIDMTLGADARRLVIATASGVAGRALKLKVIPEDAAPATATNRPSPNGGGRSRAEQDPIVRRMKEKFGAEIRTIIDYRDKR